MEILARCFKVDILNMRCPNLSPKLCDNTTENRIKSNTITKLHFYVIYCMIENIETCNMASKLP